MRIGIVGAGAIGGWLGVKLAAAGHDVSVLARGATLAALESAPWRLETADGAIEARVTASADPAVLGVQDLVVIAVKGPALGEVAPALTALIGPGTIVVPAMNGVPWWFLLAGAGACGPTALASVDPDGAIAAAVPLGSIVGSVVHVSASVPAPGVVWLKSGNRLILGEPGGGTDRLSPVADMFEGAGIDVERSASIQKDIWYKLWGNMTMNPISVLTGATCDLILDDALLSGFVLRIMEEARAIGQRIGCAITERGEDRNEVTRRLGAFKTSMLQDAEAGRRMEIEQLLGAPQEIARKLGIETPNLDGLLGLIRVFAAARAA